VPGAAWLAMVSSHVVITNAVTPTATAPASIHDQAGIGRHSGRAGSSARLLDGFMQASSRSKHRFFKEAGKLPFRLLVIFSIKALRTRDTAYRVLMLRRQPPPLVSMLSIAANSVTFGQVLPDPDNTDSGSIDTVPLLNP
jgi:hypothetical protein